MASIKECMITHLNLVDKQLMLSSSTGKNLKEWMDPLIAALSEDGAVPYLINTKERFRASPLASTIIWMEKSGLLPNEVLRIMQQKLLFLNNNNQPGDPNKGNITKQDKDINGWSLAEGVSVWSTSLAIIALTHNTSTTIQVDEIYKNAVLWLIKQQDINSMGWAYQFHKNCDANVIMASLALQALARAYYINSGVFTSESQKAILKAIRIGYDYLNKNLIKKKRYAYWSFLDKPSCTATTWALLALKEISKINEVNTGVKNFYNKNKNNCFKYILSNMPSKESHWLDEQIVCEAGAKYNAQKNYYSFKATLLMQLLELGLSPYHPKVVKQMRWLVNNADEWKIKWYDRKEICTFTYAMVISTIIYWHYYVGNVLAQQLLRTPKNKCDKIGNIIYGFNPIYIHPVQLMCKNRLIYYIIILILIPSLIFLGPLLLKLITDIFEFIKSKWNLIVDDVIIYFIGVFIIGILGFLGRTIVRFVKKGKSNGKSTNIM